VLVASGPCPLSVMQTASHLPGMQQATLRTALEGVHENNCDQYYPVRRLFVGWCLGVHSVVHR
jgi:hypothetical protein